MSLTCEICIFCYRERSLDCSNNVNDNEELGKGITLNRFVELAERCLKTNFHLHDIGTEHGNGVFGICQDCQFVVDSFCKLYHELKCLELEVEWRLNKLCNVMKFADRVSSRKQRLDAKFNSIEQGRRLIERVATYRAKFQQKYSQRCSKSLPRVLLTPVCKIEMVSPKLEADYAETQSLVETKEEFQYLGWIFSFAAVLLLCNWSQEPTENTGDLLQVVFPGGDDVFDQQLKEETNYLIVSTCEASSVPEWDLQMETESSVNQNTSSDTLGNEEEQDKPAESGESSILPSASEIVNTAPKKRKRPQSSLTKSNKRLRRHDPNVITTGLFKCFRCHRNFTSFSNLQRHRRAFTHRFTVTKLNIPVKGIVRGNKNKSEPKNKTSVDNTNFGILLPLRRTFRPKVDYIHDTDSETDRKDEKISETEQETDSSEIEDGSSSDLESSSSSSEEHSSNSSDSTLFESSKKIRNRRSKAKINTEYEHPFVCNVNSCQKSFQFEEELELHKKYHGCFSCSFCNKTSDYAPDLARHELLHAQKNTTGNNKNHSNKGYHCRRCNYIVSGTNLHLYVKHHLTKHLNLPAQKTMCKICKVWVGITLVKTHMNSFHKESESLHKCDQCPAHFDKECQLNKHKKKEHAAMRNGTLYLCDQCNKLFTTEQELETHKRLHGSFPCNFCQVVIGYAPGLVRHEIVQCNSKPENEKNCKRFKCARCKFETKYMNTCIGHYINFHLFKKRCAICEQVVRVGTQEEIHFQTHHDTNNVDPKDIKKCGKCSAYFLKEDQLQSHIITSHLPSQINKKDFPCEIISCSKRFEFEEELQNHMKQHGSFSCKYCSVVKTYAPNLAVHEASHSQRKECRDKTWHCTRCEFRCEYKAKWYYVSHFLTRHLQLPLELSVCRICRKCVGKRSLLLHNRICHRIEGVNPSLIQKCEQCPAYFLKKHQLTKHIKEIHISKQFRKNLGTANKLLYCTGKNKCLRTFETAEQLEDHRKLHGTFSCSTCDEVLTYAPKLALHELAHTSLSSEFRRSVLSIKTFKCPKCEMVLASKIQYINHYMVTHMGLPKDGVKCTNCEESFEKSSQLAKHVSRYHDFEEGSGVIANCDKCPATFGNRFYFILHKQRVHGEDNLTCVDCGTIFGTPKKLMKHRIKVHMKKETDFPLACDVLGCERRFENEIGLEWHKHNLHKVKGKIGPVIPHECGKTCSSNAVFRKHMLSHSPNRNKLKKERKQYVCEECDKVFKTQKMLESHQFSHSRPESWKYACIFCGEKSATEKLHKKHFKTHTDGKPYICEFCGTEYLHSHNLRDHKKKKHNAK